MWAAAATHKMLALCNMHFKKKCHGVKQNAKICAIGETECNET